MKTYLAKLKSVSPLTSSRFHNTPKVNDRERPDEYDQRTWREKLTFTPDRKVIINPIAFKFALTAAARYSGEQIPGKGKRTYTKLFESGILIPEPVLLGVAVDSVNFIDIYVNADGKRGSGKRVIRRFPIIPEWQGDLKIIALDEGISGDILKKFLTMAGQFIGVGQYRAEVGGSNGRFTIESFKLVD